VATETELKLAVAPADLKRLARSAVLAEASRSKPATRRVYSVYYDTPERDLARRGMALRLRKVAGRWVQTLKTAGMTQAGLHSRGEFEASTAAQLLNFVALAATPAQEVFADPQFRARLQPLFVTEFRRSMRLVEIAPGELAELCVDQGRIASGALQDPISEIELELKQGDPVHLFDFARRLLAEVPLKVENASKAERGYALVTGTRSAPSRARTPALEATMPVPDAFGAIVGECLRHLEANDRGVIASDDVEYVHQARVAIRRLRSAFHLFRKVVPKPAVAPLVNAIKSFGTSLGAARDWDVFVTETLANAMHAFPGHTGFALLSKRAGRARIAARRQARATVVAPGYAGLLLDLGAQLVSQPWRATLDHEARALESLTIDGFAASILDGQWRRVRRAGKRHRDLAPVELHALRIEVKKLRYAIEFFQALHPRKAVRSFLDHAAELQEILGALNDATVTSHLLDTLTGTERSFVEAMGVLRGWGAARVHDGRTHFAGAWERFDAAEPYW
jgi:inorganic triphosphatase YgiF